jgi:2-octaprenylphenol hydroxylase
MRTNVDVVIVGGGMVGMTLACALGDHRLKVAVLDSHGPAAMPQGDFDLRVSAITLASATLLRNLGVWDRMPPERIAPVDAMEIWEQQGAIRFDAAEIGQACLAYIVENNAIQNALAQRAQHFTNVSLLWQVAIAGIRFFNETVTVTLTDGRELHARLLVGADGAGSAVRHAAGIESWRHGLDQNAIVATVDMEQPHHGIAFQRFSPTGPLALLPLASPNRCSIVWSADTSRADALMALDDSEFTKELYAALGDRLGRVLSVSPRKAFPLALAHARRYTASRVALIGDAAHTVHPLAGQGVNLGLLDAAALAETIIDAVVGGRDIGAHRLLRRYERARKAGNLGMIAATGGFKYLFGSDWSGLRQLRNLGLDVANAVAPAKRMIMRRAAGVAGDVPRLARARIEGGN